MSAIFRQDFWWENPFWNILQFSYTVLVCLYQITSFRRYRTQQSIRMSLHRPNRRRVGVRRQRYFSMFLNSEYRMSYVRTLPRTSTSWYHIVTASTILCTSGESKLTSFVFNEEITLRHLQNCGWDFHLSHEKLQMSSCSSFGDCCCCDFSFVAPSSLLVSTWYQTFPLYLYIIFINSTFTQWHHLLLV